MATPRQRLAVRYHRGKVSTRWKSAHKKDTHRPLPNRPANATGLLPSNSLHAHLDAAVHFCFG
jgi:hypothetical protein